MSIASVWSNALTFILVLQCAVNLRAQIVQTGRVELAMNETDLEKYKAVGLGEHGLISYRRRFGKKDDMVEIVKIDTALNINWKGSVTISKNLTLLRAQSNKDLFFLLFKDRTTGGGDFRIAAVNQASGDYTMYEVKNLIPFSPTEFLITDQAALVGGYFNLRPIILYYSFELNHSKVLPGFFNEPGELDQVKTYADGSLDVIVCAKNFEKRRSLWIRRYDAQGDLVRTIFLQPEENKNLLFGRSVKLDNGEQIVAGVYGRFSDYSRGVFVAGINPDGEYTILYYNFAQLKNFFSYMTAGRQKRVKGRIERRTVRGNKIKFNYRFIIHEIIPFQNQFIMTGEAFSPNYIYPNFYWAGGYRTLPYYSTKPNSSSNPQLRNDLIFDGYQFTHAVVIGFDKNGKLEWDNSFEINDAKTMELEPLVEVKPEKDRIILMYLFRNTLRSKIIHHGDVLEGKSQGRVQTNFNPTVNYAPMEIEIIESEQLDYWYGDYFYAAGVQRLKQASGPTRRIFFVNKITYK